jgi:hypothetical protein
LIGLFAFGQVRQVDCLADVELIFQRDNFGSNMTTCRFGLLAYGRQISEESGEALIRVPSDQ